MKKAILVLLLILFLSVSLSGVKGQGAYILITKDGVVGSDSIIQDDNVFTIIEPLRNPIKIETDNIVLDGGDNKMEIVSSYDAITLIGRKNIVLQNIYVKTARNGIILESSTGCTIQESVIEGCNTDGIRLTDASTNNIIQDNTVTANERVGILLKEQSDDNAISGNKINENLVGIVFEDSHRNEVFDNQINGNTYDGIHSDASNENLFHHNEANENDQGLALRDGSTGNLVYENVFNLNLDNGIDVDDSDDNRIYDNEMGNNTDYGIDVDVCTLNHFYQNNIHDNRGGIDFDQAEGNFVYSNNFIKNWAQVTYDSEKNHWNSSSSIGGNYWSDYTGEDLNGDGYGDAPRYFRSIIIGGVETIDTDNLDYYPLMKPFRRVSEITCLVEPLMIIEKESVVISGKVSPVPESEASVSLNIIGPDGQESESQLTDLNGEYSIPFTPSKAGEWSVTASWEGNTKYHGDTSDEAIFNVETAPEPDPEPQPDPPVPGELSTRWPYVKGTIYYYGESYILVVTLRTPNNVPIEGEQIELLYYWKAGDKSGGINNDTKTTDDKGKVEFEFGLSEYTFPPEFDNDGEGDMWAFYVEWFGNEEYGGTKATTIIRVFAETPREEKNEIPGYPLVSIIIGILVFGYLSRKNFSSSLAV